MTFGAGAGVVAIIVNSVEDQQKKMMMRDLLPIDNLCVRLRNN